MLANLRKAHERKYLKCSEVAADWEARVYPVEVGCRCLVSKSTVHLLHSVGVAASKFRKAMKELGEEAKKGSYWLWLWRQNIGWG